MLIISLAIQLSNSGKFIWGIECNTNMVTKIQIPVNVDFTGRSGNILNMEVEHTGAHYPEYKAISINGVDEEKQFDLKKLLTYKAAYPCGLDGDTRKGRIAKIRSIESLVVVNDRIEMKAYLYGKKELHELTIYDARWIEFWKNNFDDFSKYSMHIVNHINKQNDAFVILDYEQSNKGFKQICGGLVIL